MLKRSRSSGPELLIVFGVLGLAISAYLAGIFPRPSPTPISAQQAQAMPAERAGDTYVSSKACRSCHPAQYDSWHRSYHRTMTQTASPTSIQGDFDRVELEAKGRRFFLSREADKFYFQEIDGQGRSSAKQQILMVTGSHHYQVYWYSRSTDRMVEVFPFVYLFEDQRWVTRGSEMLGPPMSGMARDVWNKSCLTCHSTRPLPRVSDAGTDTAVAELGIACEACHGPGEGHVEKMQDPMVRFTSYLGLGQDEAIANPAALGQQESLAVCAQCHAYYRRHDEFNDKGHLFRPGDADIKADRLMVNYRQMAAEYARQYRNHLATVHAGDVAPHAEWVAPQDMKFFQDIFWPDGVTRAIGREYTSIEPNPCVQQGDMTCLSCHAMHDDSSPGQAEAWRAGQLKPGMRGDLACTQCHQESRLASREHTHHDPGSAGSQCMSCHMPRNAYGLLSARTNHQLQSPSAITSAEKIGRVNACNLCHQQETLAWSAEHLERWYGQELPALSDDERAISLVALQAVKGHAGQRILAASLMGWTGQAGERRWQAPFLVRMLDDDYDAVRIVAYRALRSLPGFEDFEFDYMLESAQRAPGIARAEALLRSLPDARSAGETQVLYGPGGVLDEARYSGLLQARDHMPISIGE